MKLIPGGFVIPFTATEAASDLTPDYIEEPKPNPSQSYGTAQNRHDWHAVYAIKAG
jgi:hypothetical protein